MSDGLDRRGLQAALRAAHPWVCDPEVGPTSVEAGDCTRCGHRPRCVSTCGPVAWPALCATCALEVGEAAWCDGHADEGEAARAWAGSLAPTWPTVVRLWWVATGELRVDDDWLALARAEVDDRVRAALGR